MYTLVIGTSSATGPLLLPLTIARNGRPGLELAIARLVWRSKREGWEAGRLARKLARVASGQWLVASQRNGEPDGRPVLASSETEADGTSSAVFPSD
jgi:hypothetical protein